MPYVVESWTNSNMAGRVWSDGTLEQWGKAPNAGYCSTVTFDRAYKDQPTITHMAYNNSKPDATGLYGEIGGSNFSWYVMTVEGHAVTNAGGVILHWHACGYAA